MKLTHLSLFSGIGGIDLAAEWAGFEAISFCEIEPYAQKVLKKHWPDVPIIGDIRDVKGSDFREPITLLTGGVPCQPASVAGKRRGTADDRWLWPEVIRILSEIKPTWAVFENPTGILTLEDGMVFNDLLSQMEAEGYEVQPVIIPACAVNAPHRRDRVFIVAHNNTVRCDMRRFTREGIQRGSEPCGKIGAGCENVADTQITEGRLPIGKKQAHFRPRGASKDVSYPDNPKTSRQREHSGEVLREPESRRFNFSSGKEWWAVEPELGGTVNGIPGWIHSGRGLSNNELRDLWSIVSYRSQPKRNLFPALPKLIQIPDIKAMEKEINISCRNNWESGWEDGVPRVATGVKNRVDRLRCLGNAVVPQQVYPILKAIADIETI